MGQSGTIPEKQWNLVILTMRAPYDPLYMELFIHHEPCNLGLLGASKCPFVNYAKLLLRTHNLDDCYFLETRLSMNALSRVQRLMGPTSHDSTSLPSNGLVIIHMKHDFLISCIKLSRHYVNRIGSM